MNRAWSKPEWEDPPPDTFKEEGTSARVALITMQV